MHGSFITARTLLETQRALERDQQRSVLAPSSVPSSPAPLSPPSSPPTPWSPASLVESQEADAAVEAKGARNVAGPTSEAGPLSSVPIAEDSGDDFQDPAGEEARSGDAANERMGAADKGRKDAGHDDAGDDVGTNKDISEMLDTACASCAVCFDALSGPPFSDQLAATPCGHVFHRGCIEPWLNNKPNCPCCKRRIGPGQLVEPRWTPMAVLSRIAETRPQLSHAERLSGHKDVEEEREKLVRYASFLAKTRRDIEGKLTEHLAKQIEEQTQSLMRRQGRYKRKKSAAYNARRDLNITCKECETLDRRAAKMWSKAKRLPSIKPLWERGQWTREEFLESVVPEPGPQSSESDLMTRLKWMAKEHRLQSSRIAKIKSEIKLQRARDNVHRAELRNRNEALQRQVAEAHAIHDRAKARLAKCERELEVAMRRCPRCMAKLDADQVSCPFCPPPDTAQKSSTARASASRRRPAKHCTPRRDLAQDTGEGETLAASPPEGSGIVQDAMGALPSPRRVDKVQRDMVMKDKIRRKFAEFDRIDSSGPHRAEPPESHGRLMNRKTPSIFPVSPARPKGRSRQRAVGKRAVGIASAAYRGNSRGHNRFRMGASFSSGIQRRLSHRGITGSLLLNGIDNPMTKFGTPEPVVSLSRTQPSKSNHAVPSRKRVRKKKNMSKSGRGVRSHVSEPKRATRRIDTFFRKR